MVVDLVGLDLDVVADGLAGGPLAVLVERRDVLGGVLALVAGGGVDLLQLGERVVADAAGAVSCAVEPLVVDDDEAPSRVSCTSISIASQPTLTASRNESIVFSGYTPL